MPICPSGRSNMIRHPKRWLCAFLTVAVLCAALCVTWIVLRKNAKTPVIASTVDELVSAMTNAEEGDTVLVGDIDFQPMPKGMITVPKSITLKSVKETNAVFSNATFALYGTVDSSAPLTVRFENIDFRGDCAARDSDGWKASEVSAELPGIMKTMCAAMVKSNVDASFSGCTFEGYHYGYGGVIRAEYTSGVQPEMLKLSLDGCTFKNNVAKYGGTLYLCGSGKNILLDARRCRFEGNGAVTGGAVWAQDADVRLRDCSFVGNRPFPTSAADSGGGALTLLRCSSDLDGCLFADNESLGEGGALYCEITPFRTLTMKNSTLIRNSGASDEGMTLKAAETGYDTPAKAYLTLCSFVGTQSFGTCADCFGCLFIGEYEEAGASEENGYCVYMPTDRAGQAGLLPSEPCHITLRPGEYVIPRKALATAAGGALSSIRVRLKVGDNYGTCPASDGDPLAGGVVLFRLLLVLAGAAALCALLGFAFYLVRNPKTKGKREAAPICDGTAEADSLPAGDTEETPARAHPAAEIVKAWFTEEEIDRIASSFPGVQTLTVREAEVFGELLRGKKQKDVAYYLGIEITTVKDYCRKIYDKLGFVNKDDLLKQCSEFLKM